MRIALKYMSSPDSSQFPMCNDAIPHHGPSSRRQRAKVETRRTGAPINVVRPDEESSSFIQRTIQQPRSALMHRRENGKLTVVDSAFSRSRLHRELDAERFEECPEKPGRHLGSGGSSSATRMNVLVGYGSTRRAKGLATSVEVSGLPCWSDDDCLWFFNIDIY